MSSISSFAQSAREAMLSFVDEVKEGADRTNKTFSSKAFKESYENPQVRSEHRKAFSQAVSEVTAVVGAAPVVIAMGSYVADKGIAESITSAIDAVSTLPVNPVAGGSALLALSAATIYGSYRGAGKVFDRLMEREDSKTVKELLNTKALAAEIQSIEPFDRVSEQMLNNFDQYLQTEENRAARKKAFAANLDVTSSMPNRS